MSYILIGSLMGRYWKYLVVGGAVVSGIAYTIFLWTDDLFIAQIVGLVSFILIFGSMIIPGYRQQKREEEYYNDQSKRRQELGESIKVNSSKCMSCMSLLEKDNKKCPNCGYQNK